MAKLPEVFMVHTIRVLPFTGRGAYGETYGDEFTIQGFVSATRQLVGTGEEQVALVADVFTSLEHEIPLESTVFIPNDPEPRTVVTTAHNTDGDMGAWQHLRLGVA